MKLGVYKKTDNLKSSDKSRMIFQMLKLQDFSEMKVTTFLFLLLALSYSSIGQTVENANVQSVDDDLIFTFDLMPRESVKELYEVTITAFDGKNETILKSKRDSMKNVRPGNQLQFVFSGNDNFNNFRGAVDFDIRVKMTYSPIRFTSPNEQMTLKKGQQLDLAWNGGLDNDQYSLLLYRKGKQVSIQGDSIKDQGFNWSVPKSTKARKSYRFQLISDLNPKQSAISTELIIKNKIPIVIKVLPVLIVGGAVGIWLNYNQSTESEFPNPPPLPEY